MHVGPEPDVNFLHGAVVGSWVHGSTLGRMCYGLGATTTKGGSMIGLIAAAAAVWVAALLILAFIDAETLP